MVQQLRRLPVIVFVARTAMGSALYSAFVCTTIVAALTWMGTATTSTASTKLRCRPHRACLEGASQSLHRAARPLRYTVVGYADKASAGGAQSSPSCIACACACVLLLVSGIWEPSMRAKDPHFIYIPLALCALAKVTR